MDKLDAILERAVADGEDTKNKLLGAAFVVTDRNGEQLSFCFVHLSFLLKFLSLILALINHRCITYGNPQASSTLALLGERALTPTRPNSMATLSPTVLPLPSSSPRPASCSWLSKARFRWTTTCGCLFPSWTRCRSCGDLLPRGSPCWRTIHGP